MTYYSSFIEELTNKRINIKNSLSKRNLVNKEFSFLFEIVDLTLIDCIQVIKTLLCEKENLSEKIDQKNKELIQANAIKAQLKIVNSELLKQIKDSNNINSSNNHSIEYNYNNEISQNQIQEEFDNFNNKRDSITTNNLKNNGSDIQEIEKSKNINSRNNNKDNWNISEKDNILSTQKYNLDVSNLRKNNRKKKNNNFPQEENDTYSNDTNINKNNSENNNNAYSNSKIHERNNNNTSNTQQQTTEIREYHFNLYKFLSTNPNIYDYIQPKVYFLRNTNIEELLSKLKNIELEVFDLQILFEEIDQVVFSNKCKLNKEITNSNDNCNEFSNRNGVRNNRNNKSSSRLRDLSTNKSANKDVKGPYIPFENKLRAYDNKYMANNNISHRSHRNNNNISVVLNRKKEYGKMISENILDKSGNALNKSKLNS